MTTAQQVQQNGNGRYVQINGIRIYVETAGDPQGIPLVLIHGGGSTIPSNWGRLLPLFEGRYQTIAMELQAHGRTGDRDTPESFEQDAADVAGLLRSLGVNCANIAGFSDGACTTLELAIRYPDLVNKIVVISGNYKRDGMIPGFFEGLEGATFDDMPAALKQAYLDVNPDSAGLLNMFHKDRARRLAFTDRPEEELKSIKAPALLMAGDQDVITNEHLVQMSRMIPGARLALLPGNHGSFIGEALTNEPGSPVPELAAGIICRFLDRL
ncbi:alpha/beta fold hydrolase [Niabella beijingensis]|uniref:alpha/beta fold hydrolase n=1 Tax=Niabella beijingensis TaxID=2872700 RepID=UPI001CBF9056|nr:alpha/beta hydrolase [Niabella beijingensis]MBZ4190979.1 alpha/beta hydrolase [Niabella beijingensis]